MPMVNYKFEQLDWDTNYFGISSAKVNLDGIISKKSQNEILDLCKNYEFVTISNLNNLVENNHWIASRTNAFLSDMNIQFKKKNTEDAVFHDGNTFVKNNFFRDENIVRIAKNSFLHSRFFNDPYLPVNESKNIYVRWTENSFQRRDKYFVISKREENIAGFILFSMREDNVVIELIAVDDKFQGQGVGKSLMRTLEDFVAKKEISEIKVGTQVNNIQAIQFYNAMGFEYLSCSSVFHFWRTS